jgi:hypothetical protein
MEDKEKEIAEMQEVSKYQDGMEKKLDYREFIRKYQNRITQWEGRNQIRKYGTEKS